MFNVYRQAQPIPTGERFTKIDPETGRSVSGEWFRPNLVLVGRAATMDEARRLTPAPILWHLTA